jgi:sugar phosphate isomerase/epimerase
VKLAMMAGDTLSPDRVRPEGFEAVQMFFAEGADGDAKDPSVEDVDKVLQGADVVLAAMTLHVDLVGMRGAVEGDVERLGRCVEKAAGLAGRFGDNEKPVLVWHPSGYPEGEGVDDKAVHEGLCEGLGAACAAAERVGVVIAVEMTRAGSIGGAESFLRVQDRVGSAALKVCMDAANFVPDRTPLVRAVRMLGPDIAIAHGKDSRFAENGEVVDYGPTGSGCLDYKAYVGALQEYAQVPYFVFEYYRSREDLLKARDIVRACL